MKQIIFIISLLSGMFAQGYGLDDCIEIALSGKKTLLSSQLKVTSAEKVDLRSYSGLLPSLNASTGIRRTQFPN